MLPDPVAIKPATEKKKRDRSPVERASDQGTEAGSQVCIGRHPKIDTVICLFVCFICIIIFFIFVFFFFFFFFFFFCFVFFFFVCFLFFCFVFSVVFYFFIFF